MGRLGGTGWHLTWERRPRGRVPLRRPSRSPAFGSMTRSWSGCPSPPRRKRPLLLPSRSSPFPHPAPPLPASLPSLGLRGSEEGWWAGPQGRADPDLLLGVPSQGSYLPYFPQKVKFRTCCQVAALTGRPGWSSSTPSTSKADGTPHATKHAPRKCPLKSARWGALGVREGLHGQF